MVTESHDSHRSAFFHEVIADTPGGDQLMHCLQCGSCGGSCPNGADMQHTPRTIFAMINADRREEVLSSNTMWCCVSCYFCTTRCPQKIPITDIMYALKRLAIADGYATDTDAPALAKTFKEFYTNEWPDTRNMLELADGHYIPRNVSEPILKIACLISSMTNVVLG